jgi:hypothetical protein
LVLGDEGVEIVGKSKDDVEVRHRQKRLALLLKPLDALRLLALRAMPVAATVRNKMPAPAVRAVVKMASEFRGAATQDRVEHLPLMGGEAPGISRQGASQHLRQAQ